MAFKTYGELRQQLKAEGVRWTVNPAFPDDAPIKRPGLGADLTKIPVAKNVGPVDVAALVAKFPTTNTLLREHLIERGFLPGTLKSISGSSLIPKLPVVVTPVRPVVPPIHRVGPAAAGAGGGAPPTSVDWRNRWTWNFVTGIRDQDPCEHCWVYAATALVECMVRIEHCVWCDRSEGDYIEANKVPCGQCGNAGEVLNWFASNGVCGQDCVSWVDSDPGDRSSSYWNPPPNNCGTGHAAAAGLQSALESQWKDRQDPGLHIARRQHVGEKLDRCHRAARRWHGHLQRLLWLVRHHAVHQVRHCDL